MSANTITAKEVRFIKLGSGGSWEKGCIDSPRPTIRFGFNNPHHQACLERKWGVLRKFWRNERPTEVTKIVNQIQDFYILGRDALWITFYKRRLYWCFADTEVREIAPRCHRVRSVIGKWKCTDVLGTTLFIENLSGRLTKVQGFRGTICKVHEHEYLLARINGQRLPEVKAADSALRELKLSVVPLVQNLNWKDFELLVDLIFSRAGWQRLSSLGKTEKSIDLDLLLPVTGDRAFVQVKSAATLQTLKDYVNQYKSMHQYQEMFFVVHTAVPALYDHAKKEGVKLLGVKEIASLVVDSGITQWLIRKTS